MVEQVTGAAALILVGGALATLLVVALVLRAPRGARRGADTRLEAAVTTLQQQLEHMQGDLHEALERAKGSALADPLAEIGSSIDLDEVLARTLSASVALPSVEAAVLSVRAGGERPVLATDGLARADAEKALAEHERDPLHGERLVAADEAGESRVGLALPLTGGGETFGVLAAFAAGDGEEIEERDVRALERLVRRAAPALDNARRFREARRLADLDALTGLHNRRLFHEVLGREVARASRYERPLALLVLDLDRFKAINDRFGHLAGDGVLAELGERLQRVVRSADIPCRIGGEEFAVILPEATLADANGLYERLREAISSGPVGSAPRLSLSAGIAELEDGEETLSFFERADGALYEAKRAGRGRIVAAETTA